MSDESRVVVFRGIPKKEEILLRSFLNLARNDLAFTLVIEDDDGALTPDVIVIDEKLVDDSVRRAGSPPLYIVIGSEEVPAEMPCARRPLHWSSFREVFESALQA